VETVNEGGCGDAFLSAIIAGIEKKMDIEQTLKLAASVAAATAESEETVGFDPARVGQFMQRVVLDRIL